MKYILSILCMFVTTFTVITTKPFSEDALSFEDIHPDNPTSLIWNKEVDRITKIRRNPYRQFPSQRPKKNKIVTVDKITEHIDKPTATTLKDTQQPSEHQSYSKTQRGLIVAGVVVGIGGVGCLCWKLYNSWASK